MLSKLLKNVISKSRYWQKQLEKLCGPIEGHNTYWSHSIVVYEVEKFSTRKSVSLLKIEIQEKLSHNKNLHYILLNLKHLMKSDPDNLNDVKGYQACLSRTIRKAFGLVHFKWETHWLCKRQLSPPIGNKFLSGWDGSYIVWEVTLMVLTIGWWRWIRIGLINCRFLKS